MDIPRNLGLKSREILLALLLGVMGYLLSARELLLWLDNRTPLEGLFIYYAIMYSALFVMSRLNLVVLGSKVETWTQVLGITLIVFAFFITVDWESPYVNLVTKGSVQNVSPIYFGAEDGATWYILSSIFPTVGIEVLRILTFVFAPVVLALAGGILLEEKVLFDVFR